MKVLCNGQSGLNKKIFLDNVQALAQERGNDLTILNISELIYKHDPSITRGRRILDIEPGRLQQVRRAAFQLAIDNSQDKGNVIIETLLTTRWRYGLYTAYDLEQIMKFAPDIYITLIDNVDKVRLELRRDEGTPKFTLKDIMFLRELEILTAQSLSKTQAYVTGKNVPHYVIAMEHSPEIIHQLMFGVNRKKVYPSFPISAIRKQPELQRQTKDFRDLLKKHFIVFDAETISEKKLHLSMIDALKETYPNEYLEVSTQGEKQQISIYEIFNIIHDIDGQIVARDFLLIDQSDMVIALVIPDADGKRVPSSGTDQEVRYAHQNGKEVFLVEMADPGPFLKQFATKTFPSLDTLAEELRRLGYITDD